METTDVAISAALTLLSQSGRCRGSGVLMWGTTHAFHKE